jgi:hypothetical protein
MSDMRPDPAGGIFYNRYDRVKIEKTWRETLQKEADARAAHSKPPSFQMNLANQSGSSLLQLEHSHNRIEIVTEKTQKQSPDARRSIKGMDPNSFEVLAIKHLDRKPGDKWEMPELSSHDIGWLQSNSVRASRISPARSSFLEPSRESQTQGRMPPAGSLAAASLASSRSESSVAPPPKSSIVIVANDNLLERVRSAPHLPTGPQMPQIKALNNPKWRKPQQHADITNYADSYYKVNFTSPFSKKARG